MRKAIEQPAAMPDYTVTLTARELTLVRVSMMQRLGRLGHLLEDRIASPESRAVIQASYDDTHAMLAGEGKLATTTIVKAVRS